MTDEFDPQIRLVPVEACGVARLADVLESGVSTFIAIYFRDYDTNEEYGFLFHPETALRLGAEIVSQAVEG